ncbi:MAG: cytochrome P450 [Deltaproteobacteria bacterium]|nr:cytochrome P450 [Deltaproteobacteria bacterium]
MEPLRYDPFAPEVMTDPLPIYARMRDEDPVCFVPRFDCFALTRFEDIWATARDWQTFSVERGTTSAQLLTRKMGPYPALGNLDPPRQKERRKLLNPLLTPGAVRALEAELRAISKRQAALLREQGELDVVTDYAARIAIGALCLSTGFPMEDAEQLRSFVNAIFVREPGGGGLTPEGVAAYDALSRYAMDLIGRHRAGAGYASGLIALLCEARVEDGRRLEDDEIAGHLREFMIGGTETFQKAFAACVHRLSEHPDQRREIARDPRLARDAFMEALRLDTPGQFMGRTALHDTQIAGVPVRRDQVVLLIWPSGNRDPREFVDPDRFDIRRRAPRMLAFGAGVHDCLGRHLAIAEGAIGIQSLLEAAPDYRVELDRSLRLASEFIQGFTFLPIRAS